MDCWIEIIREDGTLERQALDESRVTVGRSPTAGIPIPDARDLEPEHLMVAPRADGCWVAVAQGAQAPVLVRGQPFDHGMLAWGTELQVGNLKLRVTDTLPKEKKVGDEKAVSLPTILGAAVLIPLVGWLLLSDDGTGLETSTSAAPPALFDDRVECPRTGAASARNRADADAEAALAKSERYPFSAQDGVASVGLFMRAQSCYSSIGASAEASAMEQEAELMRRQVQEDYRHHQLRQARALEQSRMPEALFETRALIELTRHRNEDTYVVWLTQLARQLQLRIDSAG